ncbi:long-chain-fatty-acid--CoA ligase [Frigoribacterium sp. CG_9.8]|uniref:long-chain-fatty-acid--CoA ligase n=1 Tax=Frigoribacterium sp. CG_9.8 TaxID=2787733 RepID=UPI0018CB0DC1|nr:long-chain-fatty-acid--CoA ligase [Frigoribacterium sp. CG_9.8]MBG6107115.1 long-chain acyl-CoA synthetase [Frigoribacterium sp. CG_9.8]
MTSLSGRPWRNSYAPRVPRDIAPPTDTLTQMLSRSVRKYRRQIALQFFGATTTYGELGDQVSRVANALHARGVERGDRVALVLPNCPQHVVAFYAVLRLGAIVVEHNPLYTERELRHQFEDHGAKVAIAWDKTVPTLLNMPGDLALTTVVSVDLTRAMPLRTRLALRIPLSRARAARAALTSGRRTRGSIEWHILESSRPLPRRFAGPRLEDTAVLQYTSGTTGSPKGAILSHRNLRANAMQGEAWIPGLRAGREVVYGVLPLFHAYGLTLCLSFALSIGARLVLFPKFDETLVLDTFRKTPATFLPAVPPIYERLVAAAAVRGVKLRGIRFAISGAMNLPTRIVELWEQATGGLLVEGYGMTESSPIVIGNPMGPSRRPGTVGVPFPSTEIRVVDPDNPSLDRGVDEEGELLVRGPQVFSGYWNRPTETAETLLAGGWLRTGDIVTVSADGFVTVVDRIKELIITGGFNVAPTEVEEALVSHPDISDAAVVGILTEHGGEDVVAAVVLRPGAVLDVPAIREHLKARMAAYKVPRRFEVVDELPRNIMGKVLRRVVRERMTTH